MHASKKKGGKKGDQQKNMFCQIACTHRMTQTHCWSVLEFWKIKLEKSSSTNWVFAGYTGSKNQVRNRLNIQFIELDFSKLIFPKSSTDQQRERVDSRGEPRHTTYSWNIKWQKCSGMGLNGFIFKKINYNYSTKTEKKILGAV